MWQSGLLKQRVSEELFPAEGFGFFLWASGDWQQAECKVILRLMSKSVELWYKKVFFPLSSFRSHRCVIIGRFVSMQRVRSLVWQEIKTFDVKMEFKSPFLFLFLFLTDNEAKALNKQISWKEEAHHYCSQLLSTTPLQFSSQFHNLSWEMKKKKTSPPLPVSHPENRPWREWKWTKAFYF